MDQPVTGQEKEKNPAPNLTISWPDFSHALSVRSLRGSKELCQRFLLLHQRVARKLQLCPSFHREKFA